MLDIKCLAKIAKELAAIYNSGKSGLVCVNAYGGGMVHLDNQSFTEIFSAKESEFQYTTLGTGLYQVSINVDGVEFYTLRT